MGFISKILLALVIGAVASSLLTVLRGHEFPDLPLLATFCLTTIACVLLVSAPPPTQIIAAPRFTRSDQPRAPAPQNHRPRQDDAAREQGRVKWFNMSKGFGFITRANGEEIFVHFRSIRGEGRRSLRDGQQVTFVVKQSDKGPQAEDVAGAA
ncbi:MAG: cold shock domain-containing protein [Halioglobus sp.]|nr:cold shock domain-containing protein [Halioglobus sp.]